MTRIRPSVFSLISLLILTTMSCKAKPTEENCKKAIENIRRIRGLESDRAGQDPRAAIRSCRAFSNQESVTCFQNANTESDLDACDKVDGSTIAEESAPTTAE